MWNMFKVNNKTPEWRHWSFSSVSIVEFEQVNVGWVGGKKLTNYIDFFQEKIYESSSHSQGCRERGGRGGNSPPPCPTISWSKNVFSHVKSENLKFLHVNNIRDFSLFIEQNISDKK